MLGKLWNKFVNRETVTYFIFGVLTTAVDWVVYMPIRNFDFRIATALGWAVSVLFAFVTNKLYVFNSHTCRLNEIVREFVPFVACRALTGAFNFVGMIVMVSFMKINDIISKIVICSIVLVLNYVFSKLLIFKNKSCQEG